MTIPLTGTGGLFTRLGKIGRLVKDINVYQLSTFTNDLEAIVAQYDTERDLAAPLTQSGDGGKLAVGGFSGQLTTAAIGTINRMVFRDNPQLSRDSIFISLSELIRQMIGANTVKACTITGSVSAITGTGNGVVVFSTKRADGLVQENTFAETALLKCTADSQSGGATAGNETFLFSGDAAQPSAFHPEWPLGSGASQSFTATDASKDNSANNLLTNSDFETFTVANTPDKWTIAAGVAGTDVFSEASVVYTGTKALKLAGGTATNTSLTQTFNLTAGTLGKLKPTTEYAHNFFTKVDVVPASGVLTVDLIDGSNAVINDDQGVANSYTVALNGLITSYAAKNGVFRTPKLLPTTIKLRFRLSTVLPGGSNLFLDHMGFTEMKKLYPGGPFFAVFSGATAYLLNDFYSVTFTNDRGGASNLNTFQTKFDQWFNMRQLELLLPSAGSPTISDSLLT